MESYLNSSTISLSRLPVFKNITKSRNFEETAVGLKPKHSNVQNYLSFFNEIHCKSEKIDKLKNHLLKLMEEKQILLQITSFEKLFEKVFIEKYRFVFVFQPRVFEARHVLENYVECGYYTPFICCFEYGPFAVFAFHSANNVTMTPLDEALEVDYDNLFRFFIVYLNYLDYCNLEIDRELKNSTIFFDQCNNVILDDFNVSCSMDSFQSRQKNTRIVSRFFENFWGSISNLGLFLKVVERLAALPSNKSIKSIFLMKYFEKNSDRYLPEVFLQQYDKSTKIVTLYLIDGQVYRFNATNPFCLTYLKWNIYITRNFDDSVLVRKNLGSYKYQKTIRGSNSKIFFAVFTYY
ncbi:hypothetical protein MHBO_002260 [Bonamia ostreae]|uniref:Uncharacterized protein n=1 Tax=Bonamia ostreae TaxID=126728 RepID=A0ABV2ALQ7_9EUKA